MLSNSRLGAAAFILAVISFAEPIAAVQQSSTIAGRVTSAVSRQPLASVQVFIGGQGLGGLTNAAGRFLILNVPVGTHSVTAERIGFGSATQTVTVTAGAPAVLDFFLEEQAVALDEIIVTGTPGGTQRRAIGNVVETIDVGTQIELTPVLSVESLLSSRVPGLMVQGTTSGVGSAGRIRIRGSSSTAMSNNPIVYVDGIRMFSERTYTSHNVTSGRLNDINPEDIASIEVIKGPAAATLYGSEASAGVIQIITKRGAVGAPRWDMSVELGANWINDPDGKLPILYGEDTSGNLIQMDLFKREIDEGFGNQFQNGPIQRYNLSVQGGTEFVRYFASMNFSDQEGFVARNWDQRTQGRLSATILPHETMEVTLNASFLGGETRLHPGVFHQMYWGNPRTRASVGGTDTPRRGFRNRTPEAEEEFRHRVHEIDRQMWSVTVNHEPYEFLRQRLVVGADVSEESRVQTTFREPDAPRGFYSSDGLGEQDITRDQIKMTTVDYSATGSFDVTDWLSSSTSVGFQYYAEDRWIVSAQGNEFASEALSTVDAASLKRGGESLIRQESLGGYVQQQFSANDRIFVTAGVRADDHSAFGPNFDAAIYPKVSGTWVVSEEPFWGVDWLQQFRVRSALGYAGQQPNAFAADRLYQSLTGPGDRSILSPLSFGNPDLGPEKGREIEAGFDAGLLDGKVGLSFTAYWKKTTDAITEREVSHSVGFPGTQLVNIGQTSNWGTETQLDLQVLQRGWLRWDWNLAFTTQNNRIDDLGADAETLGRVRRARHHVVGFPLASQFEYSILSADFVSGSSGVVENIMCDGGRGLNNRERGGSTVLCEDSQELYIGPGEATWIGSWTHTFGLGDNLQLRANIHFEGGYWVYSEAMGGAHTTQTSTLPSIRLDDPIFTAHLQEYRREATGMYRNDFARLREVALRYEIPERWLSFGVDRASVTLAGRNLAYLWTKDKKEMLGYMDIYDWEMSTGGQEFAGETQAADPSMTTGLLTVRVSF